MGETEQLLNKDDNSSQPNFPYISNSAEPLGHFSLYFLNFMPLIMFSSKCVLLRKLINNKRKLSSGSNRIFMQIQFERLSYNC